MRQPTLLVALSVVAVSACRDPTQITLELSTDADCTGIETAIAVAPSTQVGDRPPATQTDACTDGTIGSLVLVPANEPHGPVAVRVTTAVGTTLQSCLDALVDDGDFSRCIVARRSLRFIEHSPLRLPITLSQQCLDVPCDEQTTCVDGDCVDATVEPVDCIGASSNCQPDPVGGGGTGGGGGAGGGSCDVPTTTAGADLVEENQYSHLAIAADPDTCRWAVAYAVGGNQLCVVLVGGDGEALGPERCVDQPHTIRDVDVEAIGSGSFVAATWTTTESTGMRLHRVTSAGTMTFSSNVPGLTSGSLTARDGELLALSEAPDNANLTSTVVWNTFTLPDLEPTSGTSTVLAIEAGEPQAVWSGSELVVSWRNLLTQNSGFVERLAFPAASLGPAVSNVVSEIFIANHDSSGTAAFAWEDVVNTVLVGKWSPSGSFDTDVAPVTDQASGGPEDPTIAATSDGWVVGFLFANQGVLTRYLLDGTTPAVHRVVAPLATDVEVAAAGDQLGVAWLSSDTVAFRLVEASLVDL